MDMWACGWYSALRSRACVHGVSAGPSNRDAGTGCTSLEHEKDKGTEAKQSERGGLEKWVGDEGGVMHIVFAHFFQKRVGSIEDPRLKRGVLRVGSAGNGKGSGRGRGSGK